MGSIPGEGRSPGGGHGNPPAPPPAPSILAWIIPRTKEPGGLQSIESHRVSHDWRDLARTQRVQLPYLNYPFQGLRRWQRGTVRQGRGGGREEAVLDHGPVSAEIMAGGKARQDNGKFKAKAVSAHREPGYRFPWPEP